MPLNDFFTYRLERHNKNNISVWVTLNANHPLFKGHFPGQPVTPGVAIIEVIRQVASGILQKKLMLIEATDIKFISSVIPDNSAELLLSIDYTLLDTEIHMNCIFSGNGQVYTKLRGKFIEE